MPKRDAQLTFTFVTDGVASAIAKAKAAAGQRVVQAFGASVVQQVLRAGLADELHVDVAAVLLGAGLRLFDDPDLEGVALKKVGVQEVGEVTSLHFQVVK
ncbi:dihydrofolate reductase family protein [Streptomyces ureilyticus]|uniref:dihydrofolate reductase family protein n=1 Tax=Streptomyces ureilyticus TaxID=1775131 RepID=UPI002E2D8F38|nr:dihydrofolate reductase family protein [Streptomyces ureilyticus]